MSRASLITGVFTVLVAVVAVSPVSAQESGSIVPMPGPAASAKRTILLGFDGVDFDLAQRYIDEGILPNLKRLSDEGTFQPLETSNPAQSPVSWGVFNTGSNPGKTGVAGFVARQLHEPDGTRLAGPTPQPNLIHDAEVDLAPFLDFPMALENPVGFTALGAGVFFLVALLFFKLLLRMHGGVALVLALLAGGAGGYLAHQHTVGFPASGKVKYFTNPRQGTNFWSHLDQAGVRMRGIHVPVSYPPDREGPNTQLLSGLGVPDIGGSPGTWYIYTDDPWILDEKQTGTAGRIVKVFADTDPIEARLVGPRNWVATADYQDRIAALERKLAVEGLSPTAVGALEDELATLESEYRRFSNTHGGKVTVPFTMSPDRAAGAVTIDVGGHVQTIEVGGWSDFVQADFVLSKFFVTHAQVRFHVMRCDDEELRVFVAPINFDPRNPPRIPAISSPPEFAAELAGAIGHGYETIGWPSMTNPIKDQPDSKFSPQSFLSSLENTFKLRENLLVASLDDSADWDCYLQVFGTTDRTAHMLYREMDPDHPGYDAEYASTVVNVWGREYPISRAIPEIYKEMDRVVGDILARIDSGALGDDVMLVIVSDHGFQSFRWQVNLNNLLQELGFLVFKDDMDLAAARKARGMFAYADWDSSAAYSLGLGKVYLNVMGRDYPIDPWINEIATGGDGFVELAGMAGTDLSGATLAAYDATGNLTGSWTAEGALAPVDRGLGLLAVSAPGVSDQGGLALVDAAGEVLEFLSWAGEIKALDGPAAGASAVTQTTSGLAGDGTTLARASDGTTLARAGDGWRGSHFAFSRHGASTRGRANGGQQLGRDTPGPVSPERYDEVVEEIRAALLAAVDPATGEAFVTSASRRDEIFSGPWWHEGTAMRWTGREQREIVHDGFADLFLGYEPMYRVSWSNSGGGLDSASIVPNDNHWSGDHVSMDPRHVQGVLFSNLRLQQDARSGLEDIAPTVLKRYGIAIDEAEMDGRALPFEGL